MSEVAPGAPRWGFSFVEIVVAIGVLMIFAIPLIWVGSTSRVETSKAINYLRALEIAQETVDWIQTAPLDPKGIEAIRALGGSLIDPGSRRAVPVKIGSNPLWNRFAVPGSPIRYSDQYDNAFFYRKVEIEPAGTAVPYGRGLWRVSVRVFWDEGRVPDRIEPQDAEKERMRKLVLTTLVLDERQSY